MNTSTLSVASPAHIPAGLFSASCRSLIRKAARAIVAAVATSGRAAELEACALASRRV